MDKQTGSILRWEGDEGGAIERRYLLCLTPACDTLRLNEAQAFSFIEAFESTDGYNVVVKTENGSDLYLKFDTKIPELCTYKFNPDSARKRVVSKIVVGGEKGSFEFQTVSGKNFTWLGELRYSRIVSEIGKITGNWMRIGVIDSEYLRIMGKSKT